MKELYYGFNFKTIPRGEINFNLPLENGDVIYNENGKELIYSSHDEGYKLITNNPYEYLESNQLNTKWKKYE